MKKLIPKTPVGIIGLVLLLFVFLYAVELVTTYYTNPPPYSPEYRDAFEEMEKKLEQSHPSP